MLHCLMSFVELGLWGTSGLDGELQKSSDEGQYLADAAVKSKKYCWCWTN